MFLLNESGETADETLYVEDVFSAFAASAVGANGIIANGIDTTKGALVWGKNRGGTQGHYLVDTVRGGTSILQSNTTAAQIVAGSSYLTPLTNGFQTGPVDGGWNDSGNFVHWTFRKAAKFFDIVTYTGNGANRTIPHNLGAVPGMIIIKRLNSAANWAVYHRSLPGANYTMDLNSTAGQSINAGRWNSTVPTATEFSLGTDGDVNINTGTYVAYLFAHDDSADGIIQCGAYTGNGSSNGPEINLGWEPQYVLIKPASATGNWIIHDTARDMTVGTDVYLFANTAAADASPIDVIDPKATGFKLKTAGLGWNQSAATYVYIAIRKGLMRPPTDATKVFDIVARTGTGAAATITTPGIKTGPDLVISKRRETVLDHNWQDRLRGTGVRLTSDSTAAEAALTTAITAFGMSSIDVGTYSRINASSGTYINYFFKRARGFFDIVAYTGAGVAADVFHNLGVIPELIFWKWRSGGSPNAAWWVYASPIGNQKTLILNDNGPEIGPNAAYWDSFTPTKEKFRVGSALADTNANYIAYLFASCPGVSKIGTYVGTDAARNIDCGFAAGARFVMIKRVDSTGNWYYWDTARGIIASAVEPYLFMNSTAAESSANYLEPYAGGFALSASTPFAMNQTGGTFLYLAIA